MIRKMPKAMTVIPVEKSGQASTGTTLQITSFDEGLFITSADGDSGGAFTRWTRVDPQRYFVVFAAGKGETGFGAAGFAMLIKTDGINTQTDTFGTYPVVTPGNAIHLLESFPRKFVPNLIMNLPATPELCCA